MKGSRSNGTFHPFIPSSLHPFIPPSLHLFILLRKNVQSVVWSYQNVFVLLHAADRSLMTVAIAVNQSLRPVYFHELLS
jgi:hypothetical protein